MIEQTEEAMPKSDLAVAGTVVLARPLKTLIPLIKDDLKTAFDSGIEYYTKAGEKLQEARCQLDSDNRRKKREDRSTWDSWLHDNFQISKETARAYMNLAGEMQIRAIEDEIHRNQQDTNGSPASHRQRPEIKTLSDIREPGRGSHQADWYAPVQNILANQFDAAKVRREYEDKLKEKKVVRDLALQLIDIGYKVLATKLHPDKGGSSEAMSRLNEVKRLLKKFTEEQWNSR